MNESLKEYPQIIAGYIFGSRIKGNNSRDSDLDMALVCFDKNGISPVDLALKIEKIIPKYLLDLSVIDLNNDPLILTQVLNGKMVYQKSLSERVELEKNILHLYEDSLNFRKIRDHYLEKSFKEGVYAC